MESSLIPRPRSLYDARRRSEENQREAERRSSARNNDNSKIGAGGSLTLAGGIEVIDGGTVTVIGQGVTDAGVPYEVYSKVGTYENEGGAGTYLSPGIEFGSGIFGASAGARIYTRSGNDIFMSADYAGFNSTRFSLGGGINSGVAQTAGPKSTGLNIYDDSVDIGYTNTDAASEARFKIDSSSDPAGVLNIGHFTWRDTLFARLRTKLGGKLWLESNSADGAAAVVMDGAGNIDLQTTGKLTNNGQPISGGAGAVLSVAGRTGNVVLAKADVGLSNVNNTADSAKPVSTAQQAALDAKAAAADLWKPKFKNQPTNLGTGPWAQNVYTNIGPAISIPANPFGAGVPYKISFYGQAVCTLASAGSFSAAQAKRNGTTFGSNVSNTARGASETVIVFVKFTVPVVDASASTITFEWGPFFSTANLDTAAARSYFEVEVTPYTAL